VFKSASFKQTRGKTGKENRVPAMGQLIDCWPIAGACLIFVLTPGRKWQGHFGPGLFKLAPCRDIYKKLLVFGKTNLISRDAKIIKVFEHR
jgi:hypothetical protein